MKSDNEKLTTEDKKNEWIVIMFDYNPVGNTPLCVHGLKKVISTQGCKWENITYEDG